jgi:hypothetical protein
MEVFQRLSEAIRRKRHDKGQRQWFLHHDKSPSHILFVMQQFLEEKNIPVITQPPYSPDLTPSDSWLFLSLQTGLKWKSFSTK